MRKMYTLLLVAASAVAFNAQQVEYRLLPDMGSLLLDVNDNGKALLPAGYYDYATDELSGAEPEVFDLARLNNANNVVGEIDFLVNGNSIGQPGYRKDGVWNGIGYFPGTTPSDNGAWFGTANSISDNSKYVTGQLSATATRTYAYRYDTEAKTITKLTDDDGRWLYSRGEGVNNDGVVVGFVDREDIFDTGTFWVPAYFDASGILHYIDYDGNGITNAEFGEAADINNAGQIVGYKGDKAFMYDINTGVYKSFSPPTGYENIVFTSISNNGIAIGFAGYFPNRDVVVYHPSIGNAPVLLKSLLTGHGIDIGTEDGLLGTGMAISSDGNWMSGFTNTEGPPGFANGWIVNFNDKLLPNSDCAIACPENISVDLTSASETGVVVNYTLPIVCDEDSPAGLHIELIEGKESGSKFPVGNTTVSHKLVDASGNLINVCTFVVTVNDVYCTITPENDYNAISKVQFAGIDNVTDPYATTNGTYVDQEGNVEQTKTYPITIEGNTWGADNFVTVFVDWNENGLFTDAGEKHEIGSLNSTGSDGEQLIGDIVVPAGATIGKSRMRVVLNDGEFISDPCAPTNFFYGQTQDYTLNVSEFLATQDISKTGIQYYPNPVVDVLNLTANKNITSVNIISVDGKLIKNTALKTNNERVDMKNVPAGVYLATVTLADGTTQTFKVIKK